jgi:hypothetical protein
MDAQLTNEEFKRLVDIIASTPAFMNPNGRFNWVYGFFQGSPRATAIMGSLNIGGSAPRLDAVALVQSLTRFGQDIPGRGVITLLINGMLEEIGEGGDAQFLRGLLQRYSLAPDTNATAAEPRTRIPTSLLLSLRTRLSLSDIMDFCLVLDIAYEDLSGETRRDKLNALIDYCQSRERLDDLFAAIREFRPDIELPNAQDGQPTEGESDAPPAEANEPFP